MFRRYGLKSGPCCTIDPLVNDNAALETGGRLKHGHMGHQMEPRVVVGNPGDIGCGPDRRRHGLKAVITTGHLRSAL